MKRYSHSVIIFFALLCFVIALCFFNMEVPGSNRIINLPLSTISKSLNFNAHLSTSNNPHRISIYYKSKGHSSKHSPLNVTIKNRDGIILKESRKGGGKTGNREGNLYWAYTNYGTFKVPQSSDYQFNFEINSLPSNMLNTDVIISAKSSGFGATFFSALGSVILLLLFVFWKKLKFTE